MRELKDTYQEPKIYKYPNAIARVYRPVLTTEESAARKAEFENALRRVGIAACRRQHCKEN